MTKNVPKLIRCTHQSGPFGYKQPLMGSLCIFGSRVAQYNSTEWIRSILYSSQLVLLASLCEQRRLV